MLVILRWDVDVPRLVSNSVALLGAEEARQRIVVLFERREGDRENPPQMIFMLRKRPFTEAETAAIMTTGRSARAADRARTQGDRAVRCDASAARRRMAAYEAESPKRVNAVFDDSPFYFATEKPWGCPTGCAKG